MEDSYKRILISRTDRIGDVLLSTPVIKALRTNFPQSHIAVMVRPYARDIVLGNPYLDEVIIYDKDRAQRGIGRNISFALALKKKRFDLALILHPTNRAHLVSFLAGINRRVGFNRKFGFLLTDKIEHRKQQGAKHEMEYTLDVIRQLGIEPEDKTLFMPIRQDSEMYIEDFLEHSGWQKGQRLIALHPGASCRSKIWPKERFLQLAEQLVTQFKVKIVVVAGPDDIETAKALVSLLPFPCIDACGKTTVSRLASLFRRCSLLISNDSGPVHLASAVGLPVVVIFGRKQPGLSPRRWGPVASSTSAVLHKDVGCLECLAHNCRKGFACLQAISVKEVLAAARKLCAPLDIFE